MAAFLAPELWPFTLAAILVVALAVVETTALMFGGGASHWFDGALDTDHMEGLAADALGWLHIGTVPVLALLITFLTTFATVGFGTQLIAKSAMGAALPAAGALAIAFVAGVVGVRAFGSVLRNIMPKDETTAVPDASLVGRVGTIVIGTARAGRPAEARVRDEHGATHYVMVEPEEHEQSFATGASVLLVRHLRGRHFHAIRNPKPELL